VLESIRNTKERNAGKATPTLACSGETAQNSAVRQPSARGLPHGSAVQHEERRLKRRRNQCLYPTTSPRTTIMHIPVVEWPSNNDIAAALERIRACMYAYSATRY
jgi:hypothetical protein